MSSRSVFSVLLTLAAFAPAAACSGSDDSSGASNDPPVGPPAEGPVTALPSGWNEIAPGGSSTCSDGSPYLFWVRPGRVNRVVVEFRGGGACWSAVTCAAGDQLFNPKAEPEPWMAPGAAGVGIYDHSRKDNPFRDWHHVYLSYCTGDVHWGDATKTYDPGGKLETTIEHRGAANAKAALAWVYENIPTPDKVLVTGCSAGGYGAAFWAPAVKQHYTAAKTYLFADSAAGIITDNFFQESFPAWNAAASFPTLTGVNVQDFTRLPQLYVGIGQTYPDMFISQYNTEFDSTQSSYFEAMGGSGAEEWSQKMNANLSEIAQGAPSFRYYLAPDSIHCAIDKDIFYTVTVNGDKLVDWLGRAVGDENPASVDCSGNCGAPAPPTN